MNDVDFPTMAVDPVSGTLYGCMEQIGYHSIFRANLDGSEFEELQPTRWCSSLKLDLVTKQMYWWEDANGTDSTRGDTVAIKRANLDGTNVNEVARIELNFPFYRSFAVATASVSTAIEAKAEVPATHTLSPAYPNPFNAQASFTLTVERSQQVHVDVMNPLGQTVAVLYEGPLSVGSPHRFVINGSALPSGVYIYRVTGEDFQQTGKVVLLR
jgi:hypothetical protein